MEINEVENEIVNELSLKEKILFKVQKRLFEKVYKIGVKRGFNFAIKNG